MRERDKAVSEEAERSKDDSVEEAEPEVQAVPSAEPSPAKFVSLRVGKRYRDPGTAATGGG